MEVEVIIVDEIIKRIQVLFMVGVAERVAEGKVYLLTLVPKQVLENTLQLPVLTHDQLRLARYSLPGPILAHPAHRLVDLGQFGLD